MCALDLPPPLLPWYNPRLGSRVPMTMPQKCGGWPMRSRIAAHIGGAILLYRYVILALAGRSEP